jgi:hypothetical protein
MRTFRRYSIALLAGALSLTAALFALAFYLEPLAGDLTRLGWLPEHLYGNTLEEQVVPEVRYDKDRYDRYYHAVVIGDSFSHGGRDREANLRVWQNQFQLRTGLSLVTFHADHKDWRELIASPVFRAAPPKLFIYEVVERNLLARLGSPAVDDAACRRPARPQPAGRPFAIAAAGPEQWQSIPLTRPQPSLAGQQLAYGRDFAGQKLKQALGLFDSPVLDLPLTRPLFSSRRPQRLLAIDHDLRKRQWSAAELQTMACNLRQMQSAVEKNGKTRFIAMLIPDKSSAYAEFIAQPGFADLSVIDRFDSGKARLFRADRPLRAAIRQGQLDVYAPNNTHLSAQGYRIVADALVAYLLDAGIAFPAAQPAPAPQLAAELHCSFDASGKVRVFYRGAALAKAQQVNHYLASRDGERLRFYVANAAPGLPTPVDWSNGPLPIYRRAPLLAESELQLTPGSHEEITVGWGREEADLHQLAHSASCSPAR